MKRPAVVIIIGVLWIAFGILMMAAGLLSVQDYFQSAMGRGQCKDVSYVVATVISFLWIALGPVGIFSALFFLRLERWARSCLEVISWVAFLSILTFYAFSFVRQAEDFGFPPELWMPQLGPAKAFLLVVFGKLWTTVFAISVGPFIIVLMLLRSKSVLGAFGGKVEVAKRPAGIVVIALLWLVWGNFIMLLCGGALIADLEMMPMETGRGDVLQRIFSLGAIALNLVMVISGLLGIISMVCFLQLRRWARGALEVISWIALAGILAHYALFVARYSVHEYHGYVPLDIFSFAICAVPFIVILLYLRSKAVREAFGEKTAPARESPQ